MPITEGRITANDVDFAYFEAGSGPLALCLHGFPDSAWTWRHLLPALADAGFHAVAPFLRGYAPSSVPADGRYQTAALGLDANALHEQLGGDGSAVLVGHDWGAMATYVAGNHEPDRWRRLVTMAVPPAGAVASGFLTYQQLRKSWYMFFFQHGLSDIVVGMNDLSFIDSLWADWSPGYDGAVDVSHVREAIRDPERTAAAIGYYRAMLQPDRNGPTYAAQQAAAALTSPKPYLYLHGTQDGALGAPTEEAVLANLAPGSRAEIIDGVGHFLQLEKPDVVNDLVIEWLTT